MYCGTTEAVRCRFSAAECEAGRNRRSLQQEVESWGRGRLRGSNEAASSLYVHSFHRCAWRLRTTLALGRRRKETLTAPLKNPKTIA